EVWRNADALVVTGMGMITDAFKKESYALMKAIAAAHSFRVPVALFGQGLGPLEDPGLRASVRAVLPAVQQISLREGRFGPKLCSDLGVAAEKVDITGDDALEMAYEARRDSLGNHIGVNVRVAPYSAI